MKSFNNLPITAKLGILVGVTLLGLCAAVVMAARLVSQEMMTRNILESIERALAPKGVAVMVDAVHHCMSIRGAAKPDASTVTTLFSGIFEHDEKVRARFLDLSR